GPREDHGGERGALLPAGGVSAEGSLVRIRRLAPLLPVACALFAWAPLLDNYFNGDDFVHLYDAATKPFASLLVLIWGGHLLVVPNAVLYGMFRLFGADPRPYFWSVLLTHALNTALLYQVIRRFAASVALACFGATLWGSAPILEGALGWYAVYGQVLLTAIVLGVLSSLGHRIAVGAPVSTRTAVCWAALLVTGSMCFGIGLGVAMAFPLVVALALPRRQLPVRSFVVLLAGATLSYALYRLVITYSFDATAAELFSVAGAIGVLPTVLSFVAHLFGFGAAALGFDFVGAYQHFPASMQAVGGVTLALLVVIGGLCGSGAVRRRLLALLLLRPAAYGTS